MHGSVEICLLYFPYNTYITILLGRRYNKYKHADIHSYYSYAFFGSFNVLELNN